MDLISTTWARQIGTAFVLAAALAAPGAALACSCIPIPFATEFANTSHVFTGLAQGSRTAAPEYPGFHWESLQVHAVWKGSVTPVVEVLVDDSDATCGFFLTPGQVYLVFAHEGSNGVLSTHLCTRTRSYGPQDPIWQQLGPPLSTPAGSVSWGSLKAAYSR
jgi:hypothetical protein